MKTIPLTRGYEAIVDDEDYEELSKYKWCVDIGEHGAVRAVRRQRPRLMHRALLNAELVDHVNGNALDNRRSNLRAASPSQNSANRHKIRSKYGLKGIYRAKDNRAKPWRAAAVLSGKRHCSRWFETAIEAAKAYDEMAVQLFGEFAVTNRQLGALE